MDAVDIRSLAREMLVALDTATLVTPPSQRYRALTFADAYAVAAEESRVRQERGDRRVGRKIGYTNRNIWAQYNMDQPIWDHVYEHTVHYASAGSTTLSIGGMVAPRIEPEIAFRLRRPVAAGYDDPAVVLESVEWVARSFEIVDCHYADWKFAGPDSVIDFGHHAALIIGEPREVRAAEIASLTEALRDCRVTLFRTGAPVDSGLGSNALGHPALAMAYLADVVASQPGAPPLAAGEVITTGTLTAAMPVQAGETWRTDTDGLPFPPLTVTFS